MMSGFLIALFLSVLILRGGGILTLLLSLELMTGSLVVLATGFILFTIVKIKDLPSKRLVCFLTGAIISSLFVYFISTLLNVSAGHAFLYFSVFIFLYVTILHRKQFFEDIILLRDDRVDVIALCGFIGFTLLWSWQIAGSFPALLNQGVLLTWIDAYYHGAQIAQFSDMKAIHQGDIFLAGEPAFFYHRAIYMLPAVVSQAAHLSGLAAATALLIPIGFLLLAVSIYCVGVQLAGRTVGILGVIFLLVLPDNSWHGLKNGFLGFHYIIQVAPGTSYGLAGCLISVLFFVQWLRDKSINAGLLSIFFACSVYLFRAHFFVLYFPVLITAILCAIFFKKRYFFYVLGFLLLLVFISAYLFLAKKSAVLPFLHLVHLERGQNLYTDFYTYISQLNQPIWMILTGIFLLIGGILGIGMIVYPLLLWIKISRFGWEVIDYLPLILVLCYIGIVLFAPAMYQTFDELQQRPSGLLYAIITIFLIFYATKIVDHHRWKHFLVYAQSVFVIGAVVGILWTSLQPDNYFMRVLFRSFSLYQDYQMPLNRNIIQVAMFLRNRAVPGEIFLTSKDDTDLLNVDSAVVVASISGMPSYLGEQTVQSLRANSSRLAVIQNRDSVVRQSIVNAPTRQEAFNRMHAHHIAWYIALSYPKWDSRGEASDFKNDSVAVYHALT